MSRPNILLITTDEQHRSTLSCYDPVYPCMPYLDEFTSRCDVYENAYTVSPVCLPARCSIMTGLYPHNSGSISNIFGASLSRKLNNVFTELKKEGYFTSLHGKCHFIPVPYPATRPDCTLEYEHFINYYKSLGMDVLDLQDDKNNSLWYFDDYSKSIAGEKLKKYRYEAHQNKSNKGFFDFPLEANLHPDVWTADKAVERIRNADPDVPNFIWTSFSGPHYPVDTPAEYVEKIDKDKIKPRIYDPNEWNDDSKFHYRGYHGPGTTEGSGPCEGGAQKNYSEDYWKEWRQRYLANLTLIDDNIKRIIEEAEAKFGENLFIIVTTDHGEMMGNHSLWGKNGSLFQDVLRIPLLIHRPGQTESKKITETVSSLDLFPTILSAAGITDIRADGEPIDCIVSNGGRDHIISECDFRTAVVKNGYKLEINRAGLNGRTFREFYDLNKDPHEFRNEYGNPEYKTIINELTEIIKAEPDLVETIFRTSDGAEYWADLGKGPGLQRNGLSKKDGDFDPDSVI